MILLAVLDFSPVVCFSLFNQVGPLLSQSILKITTLDCLSSGSKAQALLASTMSLNNNDSIPSLQHNYHDYENWKERQAARIECLNTPFSVFQRRQHHRLNRHQEYKHAKESQAQRLKDLVDDRISKACPQDDCSPRTSDSSDGCSSSTATNT